MSSRLSPLEQAGGAWSTSNIWAGSFFFILKYVTPDWNWIQGESLKTQGGEATANHVKYYFSFQELLPAIAGDSCRNFWRKNLLGRKKCFVKKKTAAGLKATVLQWLATGRHVLESMWKRLPCTYLGLQRNAIHRKHNAITAQTQYKYSTNRAQIQHTNTPHVQYKKNANQYTGVNWRASRVAKNLRNTRISSHPPKHIAS